MCMYINNVCNGGDCSICTSYYEYKQRMDAKYKKGSVNKNDKTRTAILSSKCK